MTLYICLGCKTEVDTDLDPSPGETIYCADCTLRRDREEQLMREWFDDDLPGDAA